MSVDFATVKAAVRLQDIASRYTTLRKDCGPCPICGGKDRFFIHRGGERFGCRRCKLNEDAIGLVALVESARQNRTVTQSEAAAMLWGETPPEDQSKAARGEKVHVRPEVPSAWTIPDWQESAKAAIKHSVDAIRIKGNPGTAYLEKRGINVRTVERFSLGFDPFKFCGQLETERPAILVPWLDQSGNVAAIQYRYLDHPTEPRYGQKAGSTRALFGMQTVERKERLVATEGEVNALSVWQAAGFAVDVVSVGPQDTELPRKALAALIERVGYRAVSLWFDEPAARGRAFSSVRNAKCCVFEFVDSPGRDANEVLVGAGECGIRRVLGVSECLGEPASPSNVPEGLRPEIRDAIDKAHAFAGHCDPRIVEMLDAILFRAVPGSFTPDEDLKRAGKLARLIKATHDDPEHEHRMLDGARLVVAVRDLFAS